MSEFEDQFGDQLADLCEPDYVTVTVDDDGEIELATNLETDEEVWTFLSAAMFKVIRGVRWGSLTGGDGEDDDDGE